MHFDTLLVDTGVLGRGAYRMNFPNSFLPGGVNVVWNIAYKLQGIKNVIVLWDTDWTWRNQLDSSARPFLQMSCDGKPDKYDSLFEVRELFSDCGFEQIQMDGLERFDLAASVCNNRPTENILIYSLDKRFLPLVEKDRVFMYMPRDVKTFENYRIFGSEFISATFGVAPRLLPDLLALTTNKVSKKMNQLRTKLAIRILRSYNHIRTWRLPIEAERFAQLTGAGRKVSGKFSRYVFENFSKLKDAVDFHRPDGVSFSETDFSFATVSNKRQSLYLNAIKTKNHRLLECDKAREFVSHVG